MPSTGDASSHARQLRPPDQNRNPQSYSGLPGYPALMVSGERHESMASIVLLPTFCNHSAEQATTSIRATGRPQQTSTVIARGTTAQHNNKTPAVQYLVRGSTSPAQRIGIPCGLLHNDWWPRVWAVLSLQEQWANLVLPESRAHTKKICRRH